jgi:tetratricopeptide (TPR) repeat protein
MAIVAHTPSELLLIGYQKLTDHGFAQPIFGIDRSANAHYFANCWPVGDARGKITGFTRIIPENLMQLADELVLKAAIGQPWLSVFIWDQSFFIGTADKIWHTTKIFHPQIAKNAPLTFLTLSEYDPLRLSQFKAAKAAHRWLEKKIGAQGASSWYINSFLRGNVIRSLRSRLSMDDTNSKFFEEIFKRVRVRQTAYTAIQVEFPAEKIPFKREELSEISRSLNNEIGFIVVFEGNNPASRSHANLRRTEEIPLSDDLKVTLLSNRNRKAPNNIIEQIKIIRQDIERIDRYLDPTSWVYTHFKLGNALFDLSQMAADSSILQPAIDAFGAALGWESRIDNWKLRIAAQKSVGDAHHLIGIEKGSKSRFRKAISAYRAAIRDSLPKLAPFAWAAIHSDLGKALKGLGEVEEASGWPDRALSAYREAATAYRTWLQEHSREQAPLDYDKTQLGLASVLHSLANLENNTALLKDAVSAYHAALENYRHDSPSFDWASAQFKLGTALQHLGEQEGDLTLTKEAINAYHASLKRSYWNEPPLFRSQTMENLAIAEAFLGEKTEHPAHWHSALRYADEAQAGYEAASAHVDIARVTQLHARIVERVKLLTPHPRLTPQ